MLKEYNKSLFMECLINSLQINVAMFQTTYSD